MLVDRTANLLCPIQKSDMRYSGEFSTPGSTTYPYTYTNCGVSTTISAAPTKAVVRRSNVPAILWHACTHLRPPRPRS